MSILTRRDIGPLAFLVGLIFVVFRQIALQGRVLAGFDAEVYFYPNAAYLVAGLRAGRIPLWNPYLFAGVPFLANSQVGALYPLNYLYAVGPISIVASYLIVGHLVLFALGMYCLARASLGLGSFGATFAAAVASAGGLTGGMIGHINQVEALAWAPFSIVLIERGVVRRSPRLAVLAAIPLTLALFAGHTQVVYLTLAFAIAAGVSRFIQFVITGESHGARRSAMPNLALVTALILAGPVLAGLLAGAQLVPTLELTRASIRATGLNFADAAAGSLPPPYILTSILPTIGQAPSSTEWLAYVPVVAVLLAIIAVWRRRRAETWWLVAVAIVGLVLAFGQYTPLFRVAFEVVPGFRLFRVPARWLAISVVALALLAGTGADVLVGETSTSKQFARRDRPSEQSPSAAHWRADLLGGLVVGGAGVVAIGLLLAYRFRHLITSPSLATCSLWVGAALLVLVTLRYSGPNTLVRRAGLLGILVLELAIASPTLPSNEAVWPAAVETRREPLAQLVSMGATDRVLGIGDNTFDPGDIATIRSSLTGSLPHPAIDDYVTALKHVEGLTPNIPMRYGLQTIDGYDGGILPLARYHDFKRLFAAEGPDVADGRLRIQLRSAPSPPLLSWLNVRWLVMDRLRDHWDDGYYYDLSVLEPLTDDSPIQLHALDPFQATHFGIVLRGDGPKPPVGTLTVDVGGTSVVLHPDQLAGSNFQTEATIDPKGVWLWTLGFPTRVQADAVTVTWSGEAGTILRGLTAIDDGTRSSDPIVVSPALRYRSMGDMKLYDVATAMPRAFLSNGLTVVPTIDDAVTLLRRSSWDPRSEAVSVTAEVSPSIAFSAGGSMDDARITLDQPDRVVVQANATDRRILVLTDSYYPGWHATVDGVEAPILPVNLLFRGVVLQPGQHVVEFIYQPSSWTIGVTLSGVGIVAFILTLVAFSRRASEVDAG